MTPIDFQGSNCVFATPPDLDPSQCMPVRAYCGPIEGGSVDGAYVVVVAWRPSPEELAVINAGAPIFLSCIGGLPPHFISTDFHTATHPA